MAKKYEFIKNGIDDYTLKYKDKEIQFCSKVEFINDLQDCPRKARNRMVMDLAKQGMSVQDLIIKKTEGAKTIEDHSNKDYIEQGYIQQEQEKVLDDVCKKMFNMNATTLMLEIGITEPGKELEEFYTELGNILSGSLPRG